MGVLCSKNPIFSGFQALACPGGQRKNFDGGVDLFRVRDYPIYIEIDTEAIIPQPEIEQPWTWPELEYRQ
jgi:hypothetical protein